MTARAVHSVYRTILYEMSLTSMNLRLDEVVDETNKHKLASERIHFSLPLALVSDWSTHPDNDKLVAFIAASDSGNVYFIYNTLYVCFSFHVLCI
jgi:hypothetical protein